MPSITTREYNPTTGAFIGNVSSLPFGRIPVGSHSEVKVFDFAFTGVATVSNVKVGLIDSGSVVANASPSGISADRSSSNGKLGIMHSAAFDLSLAAGPLTRHFAGTNPTASPGSNRNVAIGERSTTVSEFVYMDVELGSNDLGVDAAVYKVFFDFT